MHTNSGSEAGYHPSCRKDNFKNEELLTQNRALTDRLHELQHELQDAKSLSYRMYRCNNLGKMYLIYEKETGREPKETEFKDMSNLAEANAEIRNLRNALKCAERDNKNLLEQLEQTND